MESEVSRKIINVASVPHRSPFRYPGGKTWLILYMPVWRCNSKTQLGTISFCNSDLHLGEIGLVISLQ